MGNVLIAIATLTVGFILATYGAYTGYYSLKRAEYYERVSTGFELVLVHAVERREELGRAPKVADLDAGVFARQEGHGIIYRYGEGGVAPNNYLWVCARAPTTQPYIEEAFAKVRDQRAGTRLGGNCLHDSGPDGTTVSVSYLVG